MIAKVDRKEATRQFFQLRQRLHRNKELQAEWNAHGEESFRFEVLEKLPDDTPSLNLRDLLAERKRAWAEQSQNLSRMPAS